MLNMPFTENPPVAAWARRNRAAGRSNGAGRSVVNGIIINVYELASGFLARWCAGGRAGGRIADPAIEHRPSDQKFSPPTRSKHLYPLQTSRNQVFVSRQLLRSRHPNAIRTKSVPSPRVPPLQRCNNLTLQCYFSCTRWIFAPRPRSFTSICS